MGWVRHDSAATVRDGLAVLVPEAVHLLVVGPQARPRDPRAVPGVVRVEQLALLPTIHSHHPRRTITGAPLNRHPLPFHPISVLGHQGGDQWGHR
jgi:hypothetical protein